MDEFEPVPGGYASFQEFCKRPDPVYPQGKSGKFRCPCCLHFTLTEVASYDICPVCFWEDDGTDSIHAFTPNGISLDDGRDNYKRIGACKDHDLQYVRKPLPEEME